MRSTAAIIYLRNPSPMCETYLFVSTCRIIDVTQDVPKSTLLESMSYLSGDTFPDAARITHAPDLADAQKTGRRD